MITEAGKDILPKSLEDKVKSKKWRQKIYEKHGAKAFLIPKELGFPVMDENGYHCGLIYAAYTRAKQYHHNKLANKAKNLFAKAGCNKKFNRKIQD